MTRKRQQSSSNAEESAVDAQIVEALCGMGLAKRRETPVCTRLLGGVSSDIWKVDLEAGPVCVKRALPKLRVTSEWSVPTVRNHYEVAWMRVVAKIVPAAVPPILGDDAKAGLFVMGYMDAIRYPLWKRQLRDGRADINTARMVGDRLGSIHAATAGDEVLAARFATDHIFHAIRLEPYFLAAARRQPDLSREFERLVNLTACTRKALVHGDISPKNILVGPHGPVFLDAECAWYGDPAFDIAFCLNHLLLKCVWRRASAREFLNCFDALGDAYLARVTWEQSAELESRAARLLGALLLARIDGKSPVEYINRKADKDMVRGAARILLTEPVNRFEQVRDTWMRHIGS